MPFSRSDRQYSESNANQGVGHSDESWVQTTGFIGNEDGSPGIDLHKA